MIHSRRAFALLAAGAITLAACGGDDDGGGATSSDDLSGADAELAEAIAADMKAEDEGLAEVFDTDCLGSAVVGALGGADRIEEKYGLTAANVGEIDDTDLDEDDAQAAAAAYTSCGDLKEVFAAGFTEEGLSESDADCLLDALSSDDIENALASEFSGGDGMEEEIFGAIFGRIDECGVEL